MAAKPSSLTPRAMEAWRASEGARTSGESLGNTACLKRRIFVRWKWRVPVRPFNITPDRVGSPSVILDVSYPASRLR